jgi:amidase
VLLYELKSDLNKYLSERPAVPVKSLAGIIEFNNNNIYKEMPWFGQEIFLEAEAKGGLEEKEYLDALALSKQLTRDIINKVMDENKLDCLLLPTNNPAWAIDWVNGDHYSGGSSDLAAIAGYPNITVPAGFIHELPIGLSFIGKAWTEGTLIKLAYSYEQASLKRKKPGYIPSLIQYSTQRNSEDFK